MRVLVTGAAGFVGSHVMERIPDAIPAGRYRPSRFPTCLSSRS